MSEVDDGEATPLSAGRFGPWLVEVRAAIHGMGEADVPCGSCSACCTSSQFVHVEPDESETLARIPGALLFPAPGLPAGHVLMGYDDRGRCPMLVGGRCSIYAHRPRTCRAYDCRVFAASGLPPEDKPLVAARVRRWRFEVEGPDDDARLGAVRAAAAYVTDHSDRLPPEVAPRSTTEAAVTAVELHEAFLAGPDVLSDPGAEAVRAEVERRRRAGQARPPTS